MFIQHIFFTSGLHWSLGRGVGDFCPVFRSCSPLAPHYPSPLSSTSTTTYQSLCSQSFTLHRALLFCKIVSYDTICRDCRHDGGKKRMNTILALRFFDNMAPLSVLIIKRKDLTSEQLHLNISSDTNQHSLTIISFNGHKL